MAVQPTTPSKPRPRIQLDTLTGLRGVLSMSVFLFHAATVGVLIKPIQTVIMGLVIGPGQAAVGWFFMLSGFVLVWVARPGETARKFYRRRIAKIFPNHLVTWFAGLALMLYFGPFVGWLTVLPSLFLIHTWIPIKDVLINVDGPNWSLGAEMFYYALFPAMYKLSDRIRPDRLWRWVFAMVAIVYTWTAFVGLALPPGPTVLDVPVVHFYFLIWFPLSRLPEFFLGMLIARSVMKDQWRPVRLRWLVGLFLAAWPLSLLLPIPLGFVAPFLPCMILLTGTAVTADLTQTRNFFTQRWAVWLGDVSFAFYLIHVLVLTYGADLVGAKTPYWTPFGIAFVLACLAISLGLAHLLHTYVENPAMRRFSGDRRRKPAPEKVPAAT